MLRAEHLLSPVRLKALKATAALGRTKADTPPESRRGAKTSTVKKTKKWFAYPANALAAQMVWLLDCRFIREYKFHPRRKWHVDFALPAENPWLLVEVEGGSWIGGRHTTGVGFENDVEKYNEALMLGFLVLRVVPRQISNGKALDWIRKALEVRR